MHGGKQIEHYRHALRFCLISVHGSVTGSQRQAIRAALPLFSCRVLSGYLLGTSSQDDFIATASTTLFPCVGLPHPHKSAITRTQLIVLTGKYLA
jgi:hypothetical protein